MLTKFFNLKTIILKKNSILSFISVFVFCYACKTDKINPQKEEIQLQEEEIPAKKLKYGFNFNDYQVIHDTVKNGESFGLILDRHHIDYPTISQLAVQFKDTFDIRKIRIGKSYTVLASKDSLQKAKAFIYKQNESLSTIFQFNDSVVKAFHHKKEIKTVEKVAFGKIYSNLSVTMDSLGLKPNLTYEVADIYEWTLDFYKLQKGDTFKLIYEEKFVDDTLSIGYGNIKAALFKHNGADLYAFRYAKDSVNGFEEYYDENGGMLRRQFLKSPIKFRYRISSKYNLNRRIAHYGYRIKPHKGTDFAAAYGTPIMATASGTVIESARRGGNGNYVKIKHNSTYSTQYLHMSKRLVKKGQHVRQGDVIGKVGSTGSSSGNHVCYRFWKHGKQVDPLKEKLPAAEPLDKKLIPHYKTYIIPLKEQLQLISN